jgi:hypothetical protein
MTGIHRDTIMPLMVRVVSCAARFCFIPVSAAVRRPTWAISTSHVERQNLSVRTECRRFTRLTNAFSKKLANLRASVALYYAHYNFVRIHRHVVLYSRDGGGRD